MPWKLELFVELTILYAAKAAAWVEVELTTGYWHIWFSEDVGGGGKDLRRPFGKKAS